MGFRPDLDNAVLVDTLVRYGVPIWNGVRSARHAGGSGGCERLLRRCARDEPPQSDSQSADPTTREATGRVAAGPDDPFCFASPTRAALTWSRRGARSRPRPGRASHHRCQTQAGRSPAHHDHAAVASMIFEPVVLPTWRRTGCARPHRHPRCAGIQFAREGFDLAIRTGALAESSVHRPADRRALRSVYTASPRWVAAHRGLQS